MRLAGRIHRRSGPVGIEPEVPNVMKYPAHYGLTGCAHAALTSPHRVVLAEF